MTILELSSEKVLELITSKDELGRGSYGIVKKYNDITAVKLYYKDFYATYLNPTKENLDYDIDCNIEVEADMLSVNKKYTPKLQELLNKFSYLENTKFNSLIKGIVTYKNYPIGIMLNFSADYINLSSLVDKLDLEQKKFILNKLKLLILDLEENNVYPSDIKESNILIRPSDLDVKIIDLDGKETRFKSKEYVKIYPHIKTDVDESFKDLCERLTKK